MQPTAIPFGQTPTQKWFYITVLILIGLMLPIHWIMKHWTAFRKKVATQVKVFKQWRCELERENQEKVVPRVARHRHKPLSDEESRLETSANATLQ
jgi:hypothetical protein